MPGTRITDQQVSLYMKIRKNKTQELAAAKAGISERSARRVVSALLQQGVLTSESTRAPLRLAFPATLASRWMPGLFPERAA